MLGGGRRNRKKKPEHATDLADLDLLFWEINLDRGTGRPLCSRWGPEQAEEKPSSWRSTAGYLSVLSQPSASVSLSVKLVQNKTGGGKVK